MAVGFLGGGLQLREAALHDLDRYWKRLELSADGGLVTLYADRTLSTPVLLQLWGYEILGTTEQLEGQYRTAGTVSESTISLAMSMFVGLQQIPHAGRALLLWVPAQRCLADVKGGERFQSSVERRARQSCWESVTASARAVQGCGGSGREKFLFSNYLP